MAEIALGIVPIVVSAIELCKHLISKDIWDAHRENLHSIEIVREIKRTCATLDAIHAGLGRLAPNQTPELRVLLPTASETLRRTRRVLEDVDDFLGRKESQYRALPFAKREWGSNWENDMGTSGLSASLMIENSRLQILLFELQRAVLERDLDHNPSKIVQVITVLDGVKKEIRKFRAMVCHGLDRSVIHPRLLNQPWVGRDSAHSDRTGNEVSLWRYGGSNAESLIPKNRRWMQRTPFSHAPLLVAFPTTYLMGRERYEYFGDKIFEYLEKRARDTSLVDPPRIQHPLSVIAGTASTSLLLTMYHYILVKQGKVRDTLVLVLVGAGIIDGLVLGLDGLTILLCLAPWCVIFAFALCAYAPARADRDTTQTETEGTGEVQGGLVEIVTEKQAAAMNGWSTQAVESEAGREPKMFSGDGSDLLV